jgi:hypothetical protein
VSTSSSFYRGFHIVLVSLDIIGKVVSLPNLSEISNCYVIQGFDHDFDGGNSPEGKSIQDTWNNQVNAGMSTEAFYVRVISFYSSDIDWLSQAQIMLRTFPFLLYIPAESIRAQEKIKSEVEKVARKMVHAQSDMPKGRTLLSLMSEQMRCLSYLYG